MTLQQLRYFCEVVRQDLNISKAAQALHVSQPGLSRQLPLRQGTPADVSQFVASGAADLSIATEPVEPRSDVVLLPCYQLNRIVLTPAGHPLLKSKRLTLERLAEYPLITYDYAFIGRSK